MTVAPTSTTTAPIDSALPPENAIAPLPMPAATAVEIAPSNLEDEAQQLEHALDALHSDPNRALSLCNEDATMFPNGLLAQEREILAIDALTRLGRFVEAKTRAQKFEADYPDSMYFPRLRLLVGSEAAEPRAVVPRGQ